MLSPVVERLMDRARSLGGRIIFPERDDGMIRSAVSRLRELGIEGDFIDSSDPHLDLYADRLVEKRPTMSREMAVRLLRRPLYHGAMAVSEGMALGMVAGIAHPTRRVIEASLLSIGLGDHISVPSGFFLMVVPGDAGGGERVFIFADCAINPDPDSEALCSIALSSARSARILLDAVPRVAMLSFSTHGSAQHDRIDKVRRAVSMVKEIDPGLYIDGELQADAALSMRVAEKKITHSSDVAGRANVLIFPDLDSGNIGYKLTQYLGYAQAIGPFMQGFRKPVCDVSRGATVDDIIAAAAVTLLIGHASRGGDV